MSERAASGHSVLVHSDFRVFLSAGINKWVRDGDVEIGTTMVRVLVPLGIYTTHNNDT